MPVTLSIKGVPDDLAERLRARAAAHHRSIQGELMTMLEVSLLEASRMDPLDLLAKVRSLGLDTPAEAEKMVREERDERAGR